MIALGVPTGTRDCGSAALDLGGALCPRASRGGVWEQLSPAEPAFCQPRAGDPAAQ